MSETYKELPITELSHYYISNCGNVKNIRTGRILKTSQNRGGYLGVDLYYNGVRMKFTVHRLVAITWIGEPTQKNLIINHKNGLRHDNRVENLEWLSQKENIAHALISAVTLYQIYQVYHSQKWDSAKELYQALTKIK